MPRSKKGRISGTKRQEINTQRAAAALNGKADGITFARVTKMVGAGHVRVAIPFKHGIKELNARIPNLLGRRGATPITTKDVVAIYVGEGYDPDAPTSPGEHFDITAILTPKQAYQLFKDDIVPEWMIIDVETDKSDKTKLKTDEGGYEFDYSEEPKDGSDADDESTPPMGTNGSQPQTNRISLLPVAEKELNIDDI